MALLFPNKLMLQNASYMSKKKNETKQNKPTTKKRKKSHPAEVDPRPSTCKGNVLSIAPRNHCQYHFQIYTTTLEISAIWLA